MAEKTASPAPAESKKGSGETLDAVLEKNKELIEYALLDQEKAPHSRIRYRVKVSKQVLEARVDDVLAELKGEVTVPGFRKGKAPKNLVRARFGKHAADEAVRKMVDRLAKQIAEDQKVEPLAPPGFDGWKTDEDGGAIVTVILEIRPEIPITDDSLEGIAVEITESPVTDKEVDSEIERLRTIYATFEASDDAVLAEHDALSYDIAVTTPEGEKLPHLSQKNQYSERYSEELLPAIAEKLVGHKKGDVVEIEGVEVGEGPEGQRPRINCSVVIREVKKRILPELDDEFAKDVSPDYADLAALREAVRKDLEAQEDARRRRQILEGVFEELHKRVEFEIPPSLVERLTNNEVSRTEDRLNQQGASLRNLDKATVNSFLNRVQGSAMTQAKTMLIADEVARFLKIEASDEDLDAEIAKIAEMQNRKPLAIRANLEKEKRLEGFRSELRIRKAEDVLIEKANLKIVEKKEDGPDADEGSPE